ncbi:hypothetical protein CBR_g61467 [Chara braunii]|uniref:Serine/threonine-protein kinase RIO1 n=1 Tax=Chara braunii TaxID=69332 RepID=A0A388K905_CHABU|nr:hypothetical protein CBR_g61467 [Chara braunii]|eukprot:GBG66423.1 hypothetical protein CBR_g61467 [Chara braunii]
MWGSGVFVDVKANVYHAVTSAGNELAIKVYKTSILVFKDRDRYVQGDFRFRNGYCRHNPRKMVKVWAEKEMRNLMRYVDWMMNALFSLKPQTRLQVDLMLFLLCWAAPRLKDATLTETQLGDCYAEVICAMRTLYQKCRLVHGDLSEYNMLFYEGRIYIIDVSQSVDLDHPRVLDFLREDCMHVTDFFQKKGVETMYLRELFDFVTDPTITEDTLDVYLEEAQARIKNRAIEPSAEEKVKEAVFRQAFIPRTLEQVVNHERDAERIASGKDLEGIYYQTLVGLKDDLSGVRQKPALLEAKQKSEKCRDEGNGGRGAGGGDGDGVGGERQAEDGKLAFTRSSGEGIDVQQDKGRWNAEDLSPLATVVSDEQHHKAEENGERCEMGGGDGERCEMGGGDASCEDESSVSGSGEDEDSSEGEESDGEGSTQRTKGKVGESREDRKAARKEHKKAVKAERRESRKEKVPKAVKKKKKKARERGRKR